MMWRSISLHYYYYYYYYYGLSTTICGIPITHFTRTNLAASLYISGRFEHYTIYGIPITHFTRTENSDVLLPSRFRVTSNDRLETARAFAHHDHHNKLSLTYSGHISKHQQNSHLKVGARPIHYGVIMM